MVQGLSVASLFPFLDIWRLAILDPAVAQATLSPLTSLLAKIAALVDPAPRPTLLTLLRLLSNALGASLARSLLAPGAKGKTALTNVLVGTLLHSDRLVRVAAASVAFNTAAWIQRGRVARVRGGGDGGKVDGATEAEEDVEWEVEIVNAIVEAIKNEQESEDVGE